MENIIIQNTNCKNTLLTLNMEEYKVLKKHFPHLEEYMTDNILELSCDIMEGQNNLISGIKCILQLSKKYDIENMIKEKMRRLTYKISVCNGWILSNKKDTSQILTNTYTRLVDTPLCDIMGLKTRYEDKYKTYEYKLSHPIELDQSDIINAINLLHRYSGYILSDHLAYLILQLPDSYQNKAVSDKLYNIINYCNSDEVFGDMLGHIIYDLCNNVIWKEKISLRCIYNNRNGFVGVGCSRTFYYNIKDGNGVITKDKNMGYMNYMTSYIGEDGKCYANGNYLQFEYNDRLFIMNEEHNRVAYYIFDDILYVAKIAGATIYKIPLCDIKSCLLNIPLCHYYEWLTSNFDIMLEL
ncbi:Hypothetical protein ORPV_1100 [Orpheovirus IHUMI-LCC2]|uniref:Uncharacterized protein n=1 Tax=Orpheovirus IHUMI-LCC2 TaxID=2023057 RepID=A0A2I2L645_9VIRU|nr:Hypothetical protein ORPV_1100 [Orpheovirus IHUMI-LCC2]SNW63004.1 Hypothetical protein ORPV_1100 [Orpheovirus IHUMI-LCC2]